MPRMSDNPAFVVEPQPVQNASIQPRQGQQITFKTDQRQYKHSRQKFTPKLDTSSTASQSNVYTRKVRFADPKTQNGFTAKQYKPGDQPTKRLKVSRYRREHSEPSFSTRKPIKVSIPMDAWQLIFQRCDLAFLLKARLVCREFRSSLERQAIWRAARINYYGDEIPDRPQGISELQYAALLVGRGCQIQPCTRRDTRKVFWPFMLRMCDKCFSQTTGAPDSTCAEARLYSQLYQRLESEIKDTIPRQLSGLLPAGRLKSGRWTGPRPLNREQTDWQYRYVAEPIVVSLPEYEALKVEFVDKVQDDPEYFLFWARLKWRETRDRMKVAMKLGEINLIEPSRPCDLREQKLAFFRANALELDPPMTPELLEKFAAYHNALDTTNAVSLRSWDILKAKIDASELRAQAEQLLQWERDARSLNRHEEDGLHDRLAKHRDGAIWNRPKTYTNEQEVVVRIAEQEVSKLIDVVHDEDILLLLLRRVREAYESLDEKPLGLNGDGSEGAYRLILDDALMVVDNVLSPQIIPTGRDRFKKIMASLRCMGCTRSNAATTYSFHDLMIHIRRVHAGHVAKDANWYRLAYPVQSRWRAYDEQVAWYQLPWFKSMPALPYHRRPVPGGVWDPDVETDYIQHAETTTKSTAFDHLVCNHNTKIPADDFTSNFCRAVRALIHTRLESACIIKVALEYATRRRNSRCSPGTASNRITVPQLLNLEAICARITARLEFKFQCKVCVKEAASARRRRRPPKVQMLSALVLHWEAKHVIDSSLCATERIVLPSEAELMSTMESEDTKLSIERIAHLKRSGRTNETMDPRTAALLETPSVRSCFDKLFTWPSDETG